MMKKENPLSVMRCKLLDEYFERDLSFRTTAKLTGDSNKHLIMVLNRGFATALSRLHAHVGKNDYQSFSSANQGFAPSF